MDFNIAKRWEESDSFRAQSVVCTYTLSDVKLEKRFGKTSVAKQLSLMLTSEV
jgi:hypothetical protein